MCVDDIEAWEKRLVLACCRNAGGWYKLLQFIENLSSYTGRLICDTWGCAHSKEAIQDHWLVDNSTVSAFGACAIVTKMRGVQFGTMEQSIRRARRQARLKILLYSLHHRIGVIVQTGDSYMPYQRNNYYSVSLVTYHKINPNVDIPIWSYT